MTTGQKIAFYRERAGLSQVDLADKLDITKQLMWKYENDKITNIPLDKIALMGEVLGVNPAVLSGWADEEHDGFDSYLEELRSRPELRMLLDVSRGVSKENIEAVAKMVEGFKK